MTDREKLIEILRTSCAVGKDCSKSCIGCTADHLLAHGVRFESKQATSDENKRWIPVSERLPEHGQEVIIYTGNILKPTVLAYQFWNPKYDTWAHVTHWMPLPEPPKEDS